MLKRRIEELKGELQEVREIRTKISNQINELQQKSVALQVETLKKEGALAELLKLLETAKREVPAE